MSRKLTAREQVLILILVVVVIGIVGVKFVVMPLNEQKVQTESEYEAKSMAYALDKADADLLESLTERYADLKAQHEDLEKELFPYMATDELDMYFYDIYSEYGLSATSVTLEQPSTQNLLTYEQIINTAYEDVAKLADAGTPATVAYINLTLVGEVSDFIDFVDEMATIPYVSGMTFSVPEAEEFYSMYQVGDTVQITTSKQRTREIEIQIEVIMGA